MRIFNASSLCFLLLISWLNITTHACTCFCFATPNGPVYGCNLDFFLPGDGLVFINQRGIAKTGFQQSTTGKTAEWVSKYGSVTFNLAGREFPFGGMNDAGLVVGGLQLLASEHPKPDKRTPVTVGSWVQYVLDTCSNVQEVILVDKKVRIEDSSPPSHYLVTDAAGNCASIEFLDGKLVSRTGDNLPVKAMSNMRYDRALAAFKRGGPRWWWSNPGRSSERFACAETRNKSFNANLDTNAVKYAFDTLIHQVSAPETKWNIVYDIAKREVWYRSVASPEIKHLSLNSFDLSNKSPLLMLDINAPLKGNVEKSFTTYDFDTNLKVFIALCNGHIPTVTKEEALANKSTAEDDQTVKNKEQV